jgi:hypothetical protein
MGVGIGEYSRVLPPTCPEFMGEKSKLKKKGNIPCVFEKKNLNWKKKI